MFLSSFTLSTISVFGIFFIPYIRAFIGLLMPPFFPTFTTNFTVITTPSPTPCFTYDFQLYVQHQYAQRHLRPLYHDVLHLEESITKFKASFDRLNDSLLQAIQQLQSELNTTVQGEATTVKTKEPIAIENVSTIATTDFSVPATDESLLNLVDGEKVQEATPRQDPPLIPQLLSQYPVLPCISNHIAAFSINPVCNFGIDTSDSARSWAPLVSVPTKLHPTTMALPSPPPPSFLGEPGHNTGVVVATEVRQDVNGVFAIKSVVGSSTHPGGYIVVFNPDGNLTSAFPFVVRPLRLSHARPLSFRSFASSDYGPILSVSITCVPVKSFSGPFKCFAGAIFCISDGAAPGPASTWP